MRAVTLAENAGVIMIVITRGATSVALEENDIVLELDVDQALVAIRQGLVSRFT